MIYRCYLDITGLAADMAYMEFKARNYSSQFKLFFCLLVATATTDIKDYCDDHLDWKEEVSGYLPWVIADGHSYFVVIPYCSSDSCYFKLQVESIHSVSASIDLAQIVCCLIN